MIKRLLLFITIISIILFIAFSYLYIKRTSLSYSNYNNFKKDNNDSIDYILFIGDSWAEYAKEYNFSKTLENIVCFPKTQTDLN